MTRWTRSVMESPFLLLLVGWWWVFPNVHTFMISWSMIRFIVETVVLWNHFIYFLVPLLLLRPDVDRLLTFRWILWVDTGAAACSAV